MGLGFKNSFYIILVQITFWQSLFSFTISAKTTCEKKYKRCYVFIYCFLCLKIFIFSQKLRMYNLSFQCLYKIFYEIFMHFFFGFPVFRFIKFYHVTPAVLSHCRSFFIFSHRQIA
jgi:hypothetical protein